MQCYPCICSIPVKRKRRLKRRVVTLNQLVDFAADFFGVDVEDFIGERKFPELVSARHITINYLIKLKKYSLKAIGKSFNKDHTTIISARNGFKKRQNKYPEMEQQIIDFNEWMNHKIYQKK